MGWETLLEKEQLVIRGDETRKDVMLEVNSGGLISNYVTLHLNEKEIDEIITALNIAKQKVYL